MLIKKMLHRLACWNFEEAIKTVNNLIINGFEAEALLGQVIIASRLHDEEALLRIKKENDLFLLHKNLRYWMELIFALYRTLDINNAADELERIVDSKITKNDADDYLWRKIKSLWKFSRITRDKILYYTANSFGTTWVPFLEGKKIPIIKASIQGLPEEYFILDTGAGTSVLTKRYCDRWEIPYLRGYPSIALDSAGRELITYPVLINNIIVGNCQINNVTAQVIDLPPNFRIGGILSPQDTFRNFTFELDFRQKRIVLHEDKIVLSKEREYFKEKCYWYHGKILMRATVDNKNGMFFFDTGAGGEIISPDFLKRLGKEINKGPTWKSVAAGGEVDIAGSIKGNIIVGKCPPQNNIFYVKKIPSENDILAPAQVSGYIGVTWMDGKQIIFFPGGREMVIG
ncbi:MAG: aspartyl protease family protein [Bacillota bacterium]|jgi:hypothetical protein